MFFGFIKVAATTPQVKVADCSYNTQEIIKSMIEANQQDVRILVLPELAITAYTCGDLFLQKTLQDGALSGLRDIVKSSKSMDMLVMVGAPLVAKGKLYNCAVAVYRGEILGVIPKKNLPNYSEFYEQRHFSPAPQENDTIIIDEKVYPFGMKLLFTCKGEESFCISAEICEDLWVANPPSVCHCMAGATIIANLSASNEVVGKASYRKALVIGQSAKLICGYIYSNAGEGESTTDVVFAGHNMIAENGSLLKEANLFESGMIVSEIDIQKLANERIKNTTFSAMNQEGYETIYFDMKLEHHTLKRVIEPYPFIPSDNVERGQRCEDILTIQAMGLKKRLVHSFAQTGVVGISGGLDSCLALLVAVKAIDMLKRPRTDIVAVTMPCFGTTQRTKSNAEQLSELLGVTLRHIDITNAVTHHFKDISHDIASQTVVFENAQARERTQILMDIANQTGGMVIGTGDLSELALGFATYNGDHMSMYGVNASIPKTLIRYLVKHVADGCENEQLKTVIYDIVDTPVSPELLPAVEGEISQITEDLVGPYELHDFFLYYGIRFGFTPTKVYFLAVHAFQNQHTKETILKWMNIFYRRFFNQQFKRSCLPDGPKVGSVSLSPRGDWRMPSDACSNLWLEELENLRDTML